MGRAGQSTGRKQETRPGAFAFVRVHGLNAFGVPGLRLDWSIQTKKVGFW